MAQMNPSAEKKLMDLKTDVRFPDEVVSVWEGLGLEV